MIGPATTRRRAAHAAAKGPSQRRSFLGGLAVALVVGLVAGIAYAYLKSTGAGAGQGKVGSLSAIVVEHATATPTSRLFPGSDAGLALTITNPNTASVTITGIAQDGTAAVSGGTGCTASNASVTVRTLSGLNVSLAHGTHSVTIATGAAMGSGAVTGCQGATFHIPVTVTVHE